MINQSRNFFSFNRTWMFRNLLLLPHKTIALFTGNRAGKTGTIAYQYVLRIMGWHPIPQRNVLYFQCEKIDDVDKHGPVKFGLDDGSFIEVCREGTFMDSFFYPDAFKPPEVLRRPASNICPFCGGKVRIVKRKTNIFRFAAENLPTEKGESGQSAEIKSSVYPEFKKWLPDFLIKKDITFRNPSITISDPNHGIDFGGLIYDNKDIIFEFMSYHQTTQSGAGVTRLSVWLDESAPYDFFEEQLPRLIEENGDIILTLTPAISMLHEYDTVFEKAQLYIRTQAVCDFLSTSRKKVKLNRARS